MIDLSMLKNGRFFSVDFIKKDGTVRTINARSGVKIGVKGTGMSYDPASKGLLTVWDVQKKDFRMINLDTIQEIRANGQVIKPTIQ